MVLYSISMCLVNIMEFKLFFSVLGTEVIKEFAELS